MLVEMLGADVSELILCAFVVDACLFYQLLDEVPQSHVFYLQTVGPVAGDVLSFGVVSNVHWYAIKARAKSQLLHHVLEKH